MRKLLVPLIAAASAVAIAAPASAQWAPPPQQHGYGVPPQQYGYGAPGQYFHHARGLQMRVDHIQREIRRLAQYRMISRNEYRSLHRDSRQIEVRLRCNARDGYGLNPREAYRVERQIARLEQRIARDVRDGRRWRHRW